VQLTADEQERLDRLIGHALFDPVVRFRLLHQRDASLLQEYELSVETCDWLLAQRPADSAELSQVVAGLPLRPLTKQGIG
jgi:hypothetical protein